MTITLMANSYSHSIAWIWSHNNEGAPRPLGVGLENHDGTS
ncbi:MAG: hypothetical protein ACYDHD_03530 [Vulcanimicrobiaceae bacterium]